MNKMMRVGVSCLVAAVSLGCAAAEGDEGLGQVEQELFGNFVMWSPDFDDGDPLPAETTCEGNPFATGVSPMLRWLGAPLGTRSYAIVLRDTSIADPNFAFHWAMWDIPRLVHTLPDGIVGLDPNSSQPTPLPARLGRAKHSQARGIERFFGPCPAWQVTLNERCGLPPVAPVTDSYEFTIYAIPQFILDVPAHDPAINPNYADRLNALFDSIDLGKAVLTGTSNAVPSTVPFACP
jgi:phosphatidylethanolamine-binding protein (PEBP) family uncharacterized protein